MLKKKYKIYIQFENDWSIRTCYEKELNILFDSEKEAELELEKFINKYNYIPLCNIVILPTYMSTRDNLKTNNVENYNKVFITQDIEKPF